MADPTWMPDVLRAAGLKCDIYSGAMNRGHGDFGNIWGVVVHHTGASGSPGPGAIANHPTLGLASQLHLDRNGKYTLCGVGIAWHAGPGSWPGIQTNNANQVTIGIEAENNGTEGWSNAQYNAYVTGVAAILNKLNLPSSRVIAHKEWGAIQGKWDPGGINMNKFREDVGKKQAALRNGTAVVNRINEHAKLAENWIGARLHSEEKKTPDGKGRFVEYENAAIYWHPKTGAFAIPRGGIYEAYAARGWEAGELGYPVRVHAVLDGGGVQAFEHGVLYVKNGGDPKGAIVKGVIGSRWASEGYENGPLGWPLSDEQDYDGGRKQVFEHGTLYWHPSNAVRMSNG